MKYLDISVPLQEGMQIWPESPGYSLVEDRKIGPSSVTNNTHIICDVHAGTHIDAPRHFLPEGETVDNLALDLLIGPAMVIDIPFCRAVTATHLEAAHIPPEVERLLIRTENSRSGHSTGSRFCPDFIGLKPDAAEWLVNHGIRLVGIDYLSIQPFRDGPQTHTILLRAGVIIIEGLNLMEAGPGLYTLICLPLRLTGAEGSPARAVLVSKTDKDFS
jgi:arylformamidase